MAVTHREVGDHVIEKGVPVPKTERWRYRGWKYRGVTALLRELRKRESVVFDVPRNNVAACMRSVEKSTGHEFTLRSQENGTVRVWRIA